MSFPRRPAVDLVANMKRLVAENKANRRSSASDVPSAGSARDQRNGQKRVDLVANMRKLLSEGKGGGSFR